MPLEPTPTSLVPPQPEILQPEARRPGSKTEKAGSGHQQGRDGALPRYLLMRSTALRDWAIMPLERGTYPRSSARDWAGPSRYSSDF